jgi:hypothetical protein
MTGGDKREDMELDSAKGDDLREKPGSPKRRSFSSLSLLIGGNCFFVVTGGKIVDPRHVNWLVHGVETEEGRFPSTRAK